MFTHFVLEGLAGKAEQDSSGVVTVSALREYVERTVREWSLGAQRPSARRDNLDLDFAVIPSTKD